MRSSTGVHCTDPCSYPRSPWFDQFLEQGRKSMSQCHSRCKRSRTETWSTIRTVAQTTTRAISRVFLGPPIFAYRVDEQTPNSEKDHLRPGTSASRGGSCSTGRHYCGDGRENDGRRTWRTEYHCRNSQGSRACEDQMGGEDVFNRTFSLACHRCECPDFCGEQSTAKSDSNVTTRAMFAHFAALHHGLG